MRAKSPAWARSGSNGKDLSEAAAGSKPSSAAATKSTSGTKIPTINPTQNFFVMATPFDEFISSACNGPEDREFHRIRKTESRREVAVREQLDVGEKRSDFGVKRVDVVGKNHSTGFEFRLEQFQNGQVQILAAIEKDEVNGRSDGGQSGECVARKNSYQAREAGGADIFCGFGNFLCIHFGADHFGGGTCFAGEIIAYGSGKVDGRNAEGRAELDNAASANRARHQVEHGAAFGSDGAVDI